MLVLGASLTVQRIRVLAATVDRNGDGVLSFDEFVCAMACVGEDFGGDVSDVSDENDDGGDDGDDEDDDAPTTTKAPKPKATPKPAASAGGDVAAGGDVVWTDPRAQANYVSNRIRRDAHLGGTFIPGS
jgi:hypothetical protein